MSMGTNKRTKFQKCVESTLSTVESACAICMDDDDRIGATVAPPYLSFPSRKIGAQKKTESEVEREMRQNGDAKQIYAHT